jgi:hypothetical protein
VVPGPGTQHRNLVFLTKNGAGPARQRYKGQLTELVPQCMAQGVRVITAKKALRLNSAQPKLPKAIPRGPGINIALLSGGNPFTETSREEPLS